MNLSWLPQQASTVAGTIDGLFYFILYGCFLFFLLVVLSMVFFTVKYRRKPNDPQPPVIHGNTLLEVVWIVIPTLLVIVVFFWGFSGWLQQSIPPENALEIRVTGQKWSWSYSYPREGIVTSDLRVPVGRPVKLTMHSKDVIHSFYVPAFRIKRDVIPKRYSIAWFEPTDTGEYNIFCTEYCGTSHSGMIGKIKVVSESDYSDWVQKGGDDAGAPSAEQGKKIYEAKACAVCHSLDGSEGNGPSWKGKYGNKEEVTTGENVLIDDNYIRESIYEPNAKIVKGYAPVMPSFKGQLTENQIQSIIEFMKTLK